VQTGLELACQQSERYPATPLLKSRLRRALAYFLLRTLVEIAPF
jgi:hypothetical protein